MDASKALILAALALLAAGCQDDDDGRAGCRQPSPRHARRSWTPQRAETTTSCRGCSTTRTWPPGASGLQTARDDGGRPPHAPSGSGDERGHAPPVAAVRAEFEARGDVGIRPRALPAGDDRGRGRSLILPEYGYVNPRLGILADGTWWFFVLEGGPSACGAYPSGLNRDLVRFAARHYRPRSGAQRRSNVSAPAESSRTSDSAPAISVTCPTPSPA